MLVSQHRGIRSRANRLVSLLTSLTNDTPSDDTRATTSYVVGVDGPSSVSMTSAIEHSLSVTVACEYAGGLGGTS
jgi:hypothetical protein